MIIAAGPVPAGIALITSKGLIFAEALLESDVAGFQLIENVAAGSCTGDVLKAHGYEELFARTRIG